PPRQGHGLTPTVEYERPPEVEAAGPGQDWDRVMAESAALFGDLRDAGLSDAAQYAVSMAHRLRFYMHLNAREAMHLIELRSTPQGHPTYRRVAQKMHELVAGVHPAIAAAMSFVDHSPVELGRLGAERRSEARRRELGEGGPSEDQRREPG